LDSATYYAGIKKITEGYPRPNVYLHTQILYIYIYIYNITVPI